MIKILNIFDRLSELISRRVLNWLIVAVIVLIPASSGLELDFGWFKRWSPEDHMFLLHRYSNINDLNVNFVLAVVDAESGGDPNAISRVGAKGLMQIMPSTQQDVIRRMKFSDGDLFDPEYNIKMGTAYLRILSDRFGGDPWLVLGAYNMGPTRIAKLRRKHPKLKSKEIIKKYAYKETQAYCHKVLYSKYLKKK